MSEYFNRIKLGLLLSVLGQLIILFVVRLRFENALVLTQYAIILFDLLIITNLFFAYIHLSRSRLTEISQILGADAKEALDYGEVGLLTFDDHNVITWTSDLFTNREIKAIGERLTNWLPQLVPLIKGETDEVRVILHKRVYSVVRYADDRLLFFKDVTQLVHYRRRYEEEQIVLGLIHFDNYDEVTQYEEEQRIAYIDSKIRQPVADWARGYHMYVRRIRSDRLLLVLNEKIYAEIVNDRFSIAQTIRKTSQQLDFGITLSMAFARQNEDISALEDMVNAALELAQGRGGDQVAVRTLGEEDRFYGGTSESAFRQSKVRIRVILNGLRELSEQSDQVFIVGHKNSDFDCIGSSLGLSSVLSHFGRKVSIVLDENSADEEMLRALRQTQQVLGQRHRFVTPQQAIEQMKQRTLLIITDHHDVTQTLSEPLLKAAKRIVVMDHHRRKGDYSFTPVQVYIEPSASSVCELVSEFFPFVSPDFAPGIEECTLMYAGMIVDTNRFRTRTGPRTFEAAAHLRTLGADLSAVEEMLQENYEDFELKAAVQNTMELFADNIVIAAYDDVAVSRPLMSQVADTALSIRNVEAAFVIGRDEKNVYAISARSRGHINVQVIMERMGGGGHFTASATQRTQTDLATLKQELKQTIEAYIKEESEDESHTTA